MSEALRDVIHVLTRPHIPKGETRAIYAEPLLETLRGLIPPSAQQKDSEGGGGGDTAGRPPISLDAFVLYQEIAERIDREWPYAGHPSAVRVPTTKKLQAWHSNTAQPQDALYLYELCKKWEAQIHLALEPIKTMALQGTCPNCGEHHVETLDEDGVAVYNPALIAYPGATPVFAECKVCLTRWDHEDLHELAAQLI